VPTSRADVPTDAPERYAKQLASHLGRRLAVEEEGSSTRLRFDAAGARGSCLLTPAADALVLEADGEDDAALARVEDVVGRHLERFGQRHELVVRWQRG
jgi:uncharacterized protein